MATTVQNLGGFPDYLPASKRIRDWVQSRIAAVFETYGFEPVQTPTLERAELLLGKYGDEADKMVYTFEARGGRAVGLRYDQTVPTARLLAQYQNELPKFWRRYQIQNVFRSDKPQRGRYREFTQCDCDIYGSTDTIADAEILAVYYAAFEAVGLGDMITIEYNDRQSLMSAFAPLATDAVDVFSIIQSIDKLDKCTPDAVRAELTEKGLAEAEAQKALSVLSSMQPSQNLTRIVEQALALGVPRSALSWNPQIARGLDYYTGLIFEGKIQGSTGGSVGGGGRYDNLIEALSGRAVPAVGFGIGFDRTVEAVMEFDRVPDTLARSTQVLVTLFPDQTKAALETARQLRAAGIACELYPEQDVSLTKQLEYANTLSVPWVAIIGAREAAVGELTLREMASGDQQTLSSAAAAARITESR